MRDFILPKLVCCWHIGCKGMRVTLQRDARFYLAQTGMLLAYWLQRDASHSPKGCEILSCPNWYAVGILAAKGCESLSKGMRDFFLPKLVCCWHIGCKGMRVTLQRDARFFLAQTRVLLAYWLQRDASHSPKGCEIFSCTNSCAVGILAAKGCESLSKGMRDFFLHKLV